MLGCRDRLALPGDPLDVRSVTLSQPDAVQGEAGIGVTVANVGGTPDANGRDRGTFYGTAFDIGAWESPR